MSDLITHIERRDNPHNVTRAQIGLSHIQPFNAATYEEVIGLERDDRYISAQNPQWVQEAFNQYLVSLGLVDQDGKLATHELNVVYELTKSGENKLYGYAKGGTQVDIVIKRDGVEWQVFNHVTINPINGFWMVDLSPYTFDLSLDYTAILTLTYEGGEVYENIVIEPDKDLVLPTPQITLQYCDPDTGICYLDLRRMSDWGDYDPDFWLDFSVLHQND